MTLLTESIEPTRRLSSKEKAVFKRVLSEFQHISASDAETLTAYAEAVVRYDTARKETKKNPSVQVPVINRSTGNVVGTKSARNPAFTTVKESLAQMMTLARRLLIDAASANKRQTLLTKRARALRASEEQAARDRGTESSITEEMIEARIKELAEHTPYLPEVRRKVAIESLNMRADFARWAAEDAANGEAFDADLFVHP